MLRNMQNTSSVAQKKESTTAPGTDRLFLPYTAAGAWVGTVSTSLSSLESFYLLQSIRTTNGTTRQASPQER
jgi:hypothetical protein